MKKVSKILTIILVVVLLAGVLSGCSMFTRNTGRYRALVAVTVGQQEITVGKILDSFNNYYNTYSAYIGQGITVEWLLQLTMQGLVSQAMKVDAYISSNPAATDNTGDLKDFCYNSQYLTKEEIEYSIRYVKYLTFQTFDSSVQTLLSTDRTINEEEKEDTSRDFTEPDELKGETYSEHNYRNSIFSDDAKEYFEKYYGGMEQIALNAKADEYVYTSEQAAKAMLDNLNGRLEEDDKKIDFTEYKNAQEKVVQQYQRSVKNTYSIDFEKFMLNQIEDMVRSIIIAKYDLQVNKGIDEGEGLTATIAQLKENLQINTDAQAAGFALNKNFVDFIESLSEKSYIYNVPGEYNYIFVKNILIPFTAQQKATLSNLAKDLGDDTDNPAYIKLRNEFATQIVAEDFLTEKDEDGKHSKVADLFEIKNVNGQDKLFVKEGSELSKVFNPDGTVNQGEFASKDEAVIEYMKRFNTDTAQHSAMYDYVVRVGDVPSDYEAKWVPEFVDAANEAWDNGAGKGNYAIAISTYGVHIVYYSADVEAHIFNFDANYLNTSTPEYRLFKEYFSQQSTRLINDSVEALQKSYLEQNKISTNKNFDRFLKDNGFEFDLLDFLTDKDED